jgi:hypothetical protein
VPGTAGTAGGVLMPDSGEVRSGHGYYPDGLGGPGSGSAVGSVGRWVGLGGLQPEEQLRPSARVKGAKRNFRMLGHEEKMGSWWRRWR